MGMAGMAGKSKGGEESGPKKKIGFAKLSRWLLTFAVCTVVYEFLGPIVLASTAFVGLLLYAGLTTVSPFFETVRLHGPTLKDKDNLVGRFYSWTIQPVVDALRFVSSLSFFIAGSISLLLPSFLSVTIKHIVCCGCDLLNHVVFREVVVQSAAINMSHQL